ncbi:MAG: SDR family oxidoreductase [Pseudomonadota bacterium]
MPVAVVTGGASGIGGATVDVLLRDGYQVVGVDLNPRGEQPNLRWVIGSVDVQATWENVSTVLAEQDWQPDALVTAAAYLEVGNILELDDVHWDKTYSVNVRGLVLAIRAVLPGMIERKSGAIVSVGSIDSYMAEQGLISYATSKGAILQLTRSVAIDHARDGITANCVCPGVTDTPFFRKHLATASNPEQFLSTREQRNPLGRLLTSEEVAETIVFLVSSKASGVTGSKFVVDAGLTTCFDFRTGAEGA